MRLPLPALLAALPLLAAAADARRIDFPAAEQGHFLLHVPAAAATNAAPPLLLFYHGQNGRPDLDIPLRHGAGAGWVVVGMGYRAKEPAESAAEKIRRDAEYLGLTMERVARERAFDPARVYVGGISAGGWHASLMLEEARDRVAGAVLLASGRARFNHSLPPPGSLRGKSVFIGAGAEDPNLYPSCEAAEVYRQAGAAVYREEYAGVGHAPPPADRSLLGEWFQAAGRHPDALRPARFEPLRPDLAPDQREFWALVRRDITAANQARLMLGDFQELHRGFSGFPAQYPESVFAPRCRTKAGQLAQALPAAAAPAPAAVHPSAAAAPDAGRGRSIPGPPRVNRR